MRDRKAERIQSVNWGEAISVLFAS